MDFLRLDPHFAKASRRLHALRECCLRLFAINYGFSVIAVIIGGANTVAFPRF